MALPSLLLILQLLTCRTAKPLNLQQDQAKTAKSRAGFQAPLDLLVYRFWLALPRAQRGVEIYLIHLGTQLQDLSLKS